MTRRGRPETPEAVLFDLDGTLVDREPLMTEAVTRVTASIGVDLGAGGAASWVGSAWPDLYAGLDIDARSGLGFAAFMEQIAVTAGALEADGFPVGHIPGGVELIRRLRSLGLPVGVVTGSMRDEAHAALRALGVFDLLEIVLTAEDYRPGKPHPACYLLAAERLDVDPRRCVAVEDSRVGVRAALDAGMWVIAVTAANAPVDHPAHQLVDAAHVVVETLHDVDDIHLQPRHA